MDTRFTPGPWAQSHRRGCDELRRTQVYPINDPDNTIATLHWHSVKTETGFKTDREANAQLIAAAPELYEALISAQHTVRWEVCEGQDPENECWAVLDRINAALAKARGENQ